MGELTTLPDMTLEEAQSKHNELKALESVMRSMLLEMRDRKGWLALGFESWADYGAKEWDFSLSQLDRLATSARIEKHIPHICGSEIPMTQLTPLAKIPESEIAAIWEEANRKAEEAGKERTAKMVQDAVNEWKLTNETLQHDLIDANKKLTETERALSNKTLSLESWKQQNNELRDALDSGVDAKVAEERAKLVLENQQAIADAKRQADHAQAEIERLKKEQAQAIKNGVDVELARLDTEIRGKQQTLSLIDRDVEALRETKRNLDAEVGLIQIHSKSIQKMKDALIVVSVGFEDAADTAEIPIEVLNEHEAVFFALTKLQKQYAVFLNENRVESVAISGTLV